VRSGIRLLGLTKRYGDVGALDALSLDVAPGELVSLLGPSGCGKTTTLRLVAGFLTPEAGEIWVGDRRMSAPDAVVPPERRRMAMIFQSYALWPHLTVAQNVAYGLRFKGELSRTERARKVAEMLKVVQLGGLEARYPGELSGGQQQRVAVARALVLEPQVLLFDEPLSNLDAKLRRRVRDDIRELQQKLVLTVAYVTHDQEEALAVSDRIIVMANATIAQSGPPRELYEAPADRFVADFVGDANIVPAELGPMDGTRATVRIGELAVQLPHRGVGAGPVKVAIRPESLRLSTEPPGRPAVKGSVAKAAYLGSHMEYTVTSALGDLFVVDPAVTRAIPVGSQVWMELAPHGVTVIPG
jgi:iron(III) transport system ATP-binding protein